MYDFLYIHSQKLTLVCRRQRCSRCTCATECTDSTKSCTSSLNSGKAHVRRQPHTARDTFSSLPEGSGLPGSWSSVNVVRTRPRLRSRSGFHETEPSFPLCLQGCPRLCAHLFTVKWLTFLQSPWLTMWSGLEGARQRRTPGAGFAFWPLR